MRLVTILNLGEAYLKAALCRTSTSTPLRKVLKPLHDSILMICASLSVGRIHWMCFAPLVRPLIGWKNKLGLSNSNSTTEWTKLRQLYVCEDQDSSRPSKRSASLLLDVMLILLPCIVDTSMVSTESRLSCRCLSAEQRWVLARPVWRGSLAWGGILACFAAEGVCEVDSPGWKTCEVVC